MKSLIVLVTAVVLTFCSGCSKSAQPRQFKLALGATVTGVDIAGGAVLKLVNKSTGENLIMELNAPPYVAIIPNGVWDIFLVGFTGPELWKGNTYCGGQIGKSFEGADTEVTINANQANCSNEPYKNLILTKNPVLRTWDSAVWDQATWGD